MSTQGRVMGSQPLRRGSRRAWEGAAGEGLAGWVSLCPLRLSVLGQLVASDRLQYGVAALVGGRSGWLRAEDVYLASPVHMAGFLC